MTEKKIDQKTKNDYMPKWNTVGIKIEFKPALFVLFYKFKLEGARRIVLCPNEELHDWLVKKHEILKDSIENFRVSKPDEREAFDICMAELFAESISSASSGESERKLKLSMIGFKKDFKNEFREQIEAFSMDNGIGMNFSHYRIETNDKSFPITGPLSSFTYKPTKKITSLEQNNLQSEKY